MLTDMERRADIEAEAARADLIRLADAGALEAQTPPAWLGALFLVLGAAAVGGSFVWVKILQVAFAS